ncbi:putative iron-sulfur-binding oxidoreductase FadF [Moorella humiferrea]|uniref:sulfate reduction electron transfer complex DsrMKJOP subunit DsrK n=1 Tax=Neomoorella humiferrea TaxID=676965 RepID=UPI0030CE5387
MTEKIPAAPYLATDLSFLGIKITPPDKRQDKALQLMDLMRKSRRTFALYMETCAKCGACAEQCHSYLGTKDINNMPVMRAELARKVYKRYFTLAGKLLGSRAGAEKIDDRVINDWYKYFYQCNECRRCAVFCPFGIDTAEITIVMREILAYLGMVPRFIADVAQNLHSFGNNMGIGKLALEDMVSFLEEELKEETGKSIPIPLDQTGVEVLYNPSSSDLFSNTDSIIGVAKMFYAAGVSWTLSRDIIETANFGLFFHEPTLRAHNQRLINIAKNLKVKRIVAGECGHGWRTWRMFTETINGQLPFPVVHVIEEALDYIRSGRIRVNKEANPDPVTYHDPCNLARAGDLIEEPREVLRAVVVDFREMIPNREKSFCCGGGGGLLMDEILDVRVKLGKAKAEAVRETGAAVLCAPCAICKAQLPVVMKHHQVEVTVKGLTDLVGKAIIL